MAQRWRSKTFFCSRLRTTPWRRRPRTDRLIGGRSSPMEQRSFSLSGGRFVARVGGAVLRDSGRCRRPPPGRCAGARFAPRPTLTTPHGHGGAAGHCASDSVPSTTTASRTRPMPRSDEGRCSRPSPTTEAPANYGRRHPSRTRSGTSIHSLLRAQGPSRALDRTAKSERTNLLICRGARTCRDADPWFRRLTVRCCTVATDSYCCSSPASLVWLHGPREALSAANRSATYAPQL